MSLSSVAQNIPQGRLSKNGISSFMELKIESIYPNPTQPRKNFDDEKLYELSISIDKHGLLEPIVVVKDGAGKFMIVAGERRYRACLLLGLKTIQCFIKTADSKDIEEISLVENIQREDLTDFEIANYVTALWNSGQYKQKQDLAEALGKKPGYISKALALVDRLDESIKEDIHENKSQIGLSVMDELSRVKDKPTQKEVYEKIKSKEIKRDDIKNYRKPASTKKTKSEVAPGMNSSENLKPEIKEVLKDTFEMKPIYCNAFGRKNKDLGNMQEILFKADDTILSGKINLKYIKEFKETDYQVIINPINYKCTTDVEDIIDTLKKGIEIGATLEGYKINGGGLSDTTLDNDYEVAIFNLLKEIQELQHRLDTKFKIPILSQTKPIYQEYLSNLTIKDIKNNQLGWRIGHKDVDENTICDIIIKEKTSPAFWEGKTAQEVDDEYKVVEKLKKEIEELQKKDIYIVSCTHKKKNSHIGGYRVRAYNRDEAIELAKEYYHEETNEKDYIFEALTLKENEQEVFANENNFRDFPIFNAYKLGHEGKKHQCYLQIPYEIHEKLEQGVEYQLMLNTQDTNVLFNENKPKEIQKINIHPKQTTIDNFTKVDQEKIIKHMEVFEKNIYIEFTDGDHETVSHTKAKKIIKDTTQKEISYEIHGQTQKTCDFVNKIPHRSQVNGKLILKEK